MTFALPREKELFPVASRFRRRGTPFLDSSKQKLSVERLVHEFIPRKRISQRSVESLQCEGSCLWDFCAAFVPMQIYLISSCLEPQIRFPMCRRLSSALVGNIPTYPLPQKLRVCSLICAKIYMLTFHSIESSIDGQQRKPSLLQHVLFVVFVEKSRTQFLERWQDCISTDAAGLLYRRT